MAGVRAESHPIKYVFWGCPKISPLMIMGASRELSKPIVFADQYKDISLLAARQCQDG